MKTSKYPVLQGSADFVCLRLFHSSADQKPADIRRETAKSLFYF